MLNSADLLTLLLTFLFSRDIHANIEGEFYMQWHFHGVKNHEYIDEYDDLHATILIQFAERELFNI